MSESIRVLIVDDLPETRENVRKLLQFESDITVVGEAGNGEEAIVMAKSSVPDVVLMDINMPGMDGIQASETLEQILPDTAVVIMSVQGEAEYLRRAMTAGVRDYLVKPFGSRQLTDAIRRANESRISSSIALSFDEPDEIVESDVGKAKIITVFSPMGGAGCTTVAVNLGVVLVEAGHKVLLIDASLQFGDVGVVLNIKSPSTVVDLINQVDELDSDLAASAIATHESGLQVLLAPNRPEMAEVVTAEKFKSVLNFLLPRYDYVLIDTASILSEVTIQVLDDSDRILLLTQQSVQGLRNLRRFLDVTQDLDYELDRILLVVNQTSKRNPVAVERLAEALKMDVAAVIPRSRAVQRAADDGQPFVQAGMATRAATKAMIDLAQRLTREIPAEIRASA